ncbi:hypothetical protein C437_15486 [Haloarcula vallismortis ATCC 29715]|uniref:Transcription regulator n=1 Tax=Haloarcula vallismortis ATCC 29715 TaxID=662477 RepID=M0J268_HALVA|nr:winged helix-turn-helix domain-containing protein [Haloarcula vallismortis]EMA01835.1 hypothetical protein C437_15486 [Haloarcula vallismortis ATCC 29715]
MSADVNFDDVSIVKSSKYREAVVRELAEGPATPSEIAEAVHEEIAHISRALNEMREDDLVELLVSEDRKKGRIYGLTDGGEKVQSYLSDR